MTYKRAVLLMLISIYGVLSILVKMRIDPSYDATEHVERINKTTESLINNIYDSKLV